MYLWIIPEVNTPLSHSLGTSVPKFVCSTSSGKFCMIFCLFSSSILDNLKWKNQSATGKETILWKHKNFHATTCTYHHFTTMDETAKLLLREMFKSHIEQRWNMDFFVTRNNVEISLLQEKHMKLTPSDQTDFFRKTHSTCLIKYNLD